LCWEHLPTFKPVEEGAKHPGRSGEKTVVILKFYIFLYLMNITQNKNNFMKNNLIALILLCMPFIVVAQQEACGTRMTDKNRHKYASNFMRNPPHIYNVPVIFHVIFNSENQNIPDSLIKAILETLHNDFLSLNSDLPNVPAEFKPVSGNANINFVLANKLPDGSTTTGIIRKHTTTKLFKLTERKIFTESAIVKSDSYLNVYVCNTNTNAFTPSENNPGHDGIVIHYTKVNKGSRTLTHEAGHWLNLYHIFEGGCGNKDTVKDTPPQKKHSMGKCLTHPLNECGQHAMFMNFMDYSLCRYFFTAGQVQRMWDYIEENKKFDTPVLPLVTDTAVVAELNAGKVSFVNLSVALNYPQSLKKTIQQAYSRSLPLVINYDQESGTIISCKLISLKKQVGVNTELAFLTEPQSLVTEVQTAHADTIGGVQLDTTISSLKLAAIFNYFVSLSCSNAQPCITDGKPCITFKYKANGCQARAHMMRYYLEDSFMISCKKVFLFGNLRAKNSGTCDGDCITWGWHVAPVVNEKSPDGVITQKIIDPSLFGRPVTIEEWKAAQINCAADSRIDTMYVVDSKFYSWNFTGRGNNKKRYFYEDIDEYGPRSYTVGFLRSKCRRCN
jgi:hypothetical protein